jgi:hypothetical protein
LGKTSLPWTKWEPLSGQVENLQPTQDRTITEIPAQVVLRPIRSNSGREVDEEHHYSLASVSGNMVRGNVSNKVENKTVSNGNISKFLSKKICWGLLPLIVIGGLSTTFLIVPKGNM